MKKKAAIDAFCLVFLFCLIFSLNSIVMAKQVRVGYAEDPPLAFRDPTTGKPRGFYIDVLNAIGRLEHWDLKYDYNASWPQVLARLKDGDIDLLLTIAYSEPRAKLYDFNNETFLTNWAQVVVPSESSIESVIDLNEKTIAVIANDIYEKAIKDLVKRFDIHAQFLTVQGGYTRICERIARGDADAGVVTRLFILATHQAGIKKTPILFHPVSLRCATAKGRNRHLLQAIDIHLADMKKDPESIYYVALKRWLEIVPPQPSSFPRWLFLTGLALAVCLALVLGIVLLLRFRIKEKTSDLVSKLSELQGEIEKRKRIEKDLEQRESQWRTLFESAQDGIIILDNNARILEANPASLSLFDMPKSKIIGRFPWEFSPLYQPDGIESMTKARKYIDKALQGKPQRFEWQYQNVSGSRFFAEVFLNRMPLPDTQGLLAFVRDISYRKEIETRLRATLDGSPIPTFIIDTAGVVTLWNRSCEQMTQIKASDILGKPLDLSPLFGGKKWTPLASLLLERSLEEILATSANSSLRRNVSHPEALETKGRILVSGNWIPVQVVAARIRDRDGRLLGVIQCAQDLSREEALHKQFLQAQKMEAVGRMAGGVAHDFNNILTVILGYCEIMAAQENMQPNFLEWIEEIKKAGQRAKDLTSQLLVFSRHQVTKPTVVNLSEVVSDLGKMIHRFTGEDITVELNLQEDLSSVYLDRTQVQQMVMNIVINARDAMPHGGSLIISTKRLQCDTPIKQGVFHVPPGKYVRLSIQDTGIGMSEETLSKMFEPFYTTKPRGKGTGLGLSMVYGIVQQCHGHILVESQPGKGTCFSLYFPIMEADNRQHYKRERKRGFDKSRLAEQEKKYRVMVVEDDDTVRKTIVETLRLCGYRTLQADTAEETIKRCDVSSESVDLLITDIVMPGMSGIELAEIASEHCPGVGILLISGYSEERVDIERISAKGWQFLQKPFAPVDLINKVQEILKSKPGSNDSKNGATQDGTD